MHKDDLELVEEVESETGFKNVNVKVDQKDAPVHVYIEGKNSSDQFVLLREGVVAGDPDHEDLQCDFPINVILESGDLFVFKNLRVYASGTITTTYEERS